MRLAAVVSTGLALSGLVGGCTSIGGDGSGSTRAPLGEGAAAGGNPFAAVEVRVHPLTRVVAEPADATTPGAQIEAHIELLDSYGAVVRDVGVMRFELYRGVPGVDPEAAPASATNELTWTLDLTDPARSARQFDRITRTYVAPLPGAPAWVFTDTPATLRVEFTTADNRRMVALRRLRTN